jgi:Response regulator of the LytR/AlgR family
MLHFIILDDDVVHNANTGKRLGSVFKKNGIEASIALNTTKPSEVIDYCSKNSNRNNVYLLDVNVQSKINGIDIAGIIREQDVKAYIVFISAYSEFVMLSLKTRVFDYLIKPVCAETLEACVISINKDFTKSNNKNVQTISIKSGFVLHTLKVEEITYLEKFGHILVVHTILGKIESSESLESIEKKLDNRLFFRCHKSYIVNISYISQIDYPKCTIYLKNGESCIVSKRCKKELKAICS